VRGQGHRSEPQCDWQAAVTVAPALAMPAHPFDNGFPDVAMSAISFRSSSVRYTMV
jgi:hypothetical protein